jgi:hypothetical protein
MDMLGNPGAEGLQEGFLCGEPTGVEQARVGLALGENLLSLRERSVKETLSVSPDYAGHAVDVAEIVTDAKDRQGEPP